MWILIYLFMKPVHFCSSSFLFLLSFFVWNRLWGQGICVMYPLVCISYVWKGYVQKHPFHINTRNECIVLWYDDVFVRHTGCVFWKCCEWHFETRQYRLPSAWLHGRLEREGQPFDILCWTLHSVSTCITVQTDRQSEWSWLFSLSFPTVPMASVRMDW